MMDSLLVAYAQYLFDSGGTFQQAAHSILAVQSVSRICDTSYSWLGVPSFRGDVIAPHVPVSLSLSACCKPW